MSYKYSCLVFVVMLGISCNVAANAVVLAGDQENKVLEARAKGSYIEAENILKNKIKLTGIKGVNLVDVLQLADIYHKQGKIIKEVELFSKFQSRFSSVKSQSQLFQIHSRYSRSLKSINQFERAIEELEKAGLIVNELNDQILKLEYLNDLATVYMASENYSRALELFNQAFTLSLQTDDNALISSVSINLIRAKINTKDQKKIEALVKVSSLSTKKIKNDLLRVKNLLALGKLLHTMQLEFDKGIGYRKKSYGMLRQALLESQEHRFLNYTAYAFGYIAELYETEERYDEALFYSRKAAFEAHAINDMESLYIWQWQIARNLTKSGESKLAIISYEQALSTLGEIRADLIRGSKNTFQQKVGPIYYELISLLLDKSLHTTSAEDTQLTLDQIKSVVEQLKAAEISNYFENDCVLKSDKFVLTGLKHTSAAIYPIILKDRLLVLVDVGEKLYFKEVKVSDKKLKSEVIRLRNNIDSYNGDDDYKIQAEKIYSWLITPVEELLEENNIQTLVFVPDGILRSVPMAVLSDGNKFLIQKYALATTPGMNLTSSSKNKFINSQVLVSGISEAVQGYSALPSVVAEVEKINKIFPSKTYLNKDFLLKNVNKEMKESEFSIVHIATHGEFNRDHKKSFLLAYDEKLTLSKLERFIGRQGTNKDDIDLLVMSACQTAAGDDRAALGLAGVALKAGAKSALATLWFINDQATSELIIKFYEGLSTGSKTKSQALQSAQISLINSEKFNHPSFWSPFLLIGNWL